MQPEEGLVVPSTRSTLKSYGALGTGSNPPAGTVHRSCPGTQATAAPTHCLSGPAPYPGPQYLPCPWCHVKALCARVSSCCVHLSLATETQHPRGARLSPGAEGPTSWGCLMQSGSICTQVCLHLRPAACLPLLWEFSAGGCLRHLLHLDDVSGENMAEESFRGQGTPRGVWKIITPGQQGTFI